MWGRGLDVYCMHYTIKNLYKNLGLEPKYILKINSNQFSRSIIVWDPLRVKSFSLFIKDRLTVKETLVRCEQLITGTQL